MNGIFQFKDNSSDWERITTQRGKLLNHVKYGSETVWNLGAKLWDILPEDVKAEALKDFKKLIRVFMIFYLCQNSIRLILYKVEINK